MATPTSPTSTVWHVSTGRRSPCGTARAVSPAGLRSPATPVWYVAPSMGNQQQQVTPPSTIPPQRFSIKVPLGADGTPNRTTMIPRVGLAARRHAKKIKQRLEEMSKENVIPEAEGNIIKEYIMRIADRAKRSGLVRSFIRSMWPSDREFNTLDPLIFNRDGRHYDENLKIAQENGAFTDNPSLSNEVWRPQIGDPGIDDEEDVLMIEGFRLKCHQLYRRLQATGSLPRAVTELDSETIEAADKKHRERFMRSVRYIESRAQEVHTLVNNPLELEAWDKFVRSAREANHYIPEDKNANQSEHMLPPGAKQALARMERDGFGPLMERLYDDREEWIAEVRRHHGEDIDIDDFGTVDDPELAEDLERTLDQAKQEWYRTWYRRELVIASEQKWEAVARDIVAKENGYRYFPYAFNCNGESNEIHTEYHPFNCQCGLCPPESKQREEEATTEGAPSDDEGSVHGEVLQSIESSATISSSELIDVCHKPHGTQGPTFLRKGKVMIDDIDDENVERTPTKQRQIAVEDSQERVEDAEDSEPTTHKLPLVSPTPRPKYLIKIKIPPHVDHRSARAQISDSDQQNDEDEENIAPAPATLSGKPVNTEQPSTDEILSESYRGLKKNNKKKTAKKTTKKRKRVSATKKDDNDYTPDSEDEREVKKPCYRVNTRASYRIASASSYDGAYGADEEMSDASYASSSEGL